VGGSKTTSLQNRSRFIIDYVMFERVIRISFGSYEHNQKMAVITDSFRLFGFSTNAEESYIILILGEILISYQSSRVIMYNIG
jgi:hypothetical protein